MKYHPLTRADVPGCFRLLEDWFEEKRNGDPYMRAERMAIIQALASFERLGLKGGVVKVGGRVEAFTMGGRLTADMAVIPIEIANPGLVGLAQWINREFVCREWRRYAVHQPGAGHEHRGPAEGEAVLPARPAGEEVQPHPCRLKNVPQVRS